jgi:hypothetical protein
LFMLKATGSIHAPPDDIGRLFSSRAHIPSVRRPDAIARASPPAGPLSAHEAVFVSLHSRVAPSACLSAKARG